MADYTKNAEIVNNPSEDDMMLMGDFGPGNARMLTESEMDTRDEISAKIEAGIPLTPDERGLVPGPENMYFDERVGRNVPVGTPNQQIMDEARRMGRDPFPAAEGLRSVEGPRTSRGMAPDQFPSPEGLSSVGRVEPMSGRISERSVDELIGASPAGPALKPLGPPTRAESIQERIEELKRQQQILRERLDDSRRQRVDDLRRKNRTRLERDLEAARQRLDDFERQQQPRLESMRESMREETERFIQEERSRQLEEFRRQRQLEELRRQQRILFEMDLNQLSPQEARMQRMITGNRRR